MSRTLIRFCGTTFLKTAVYNRLFRNRLETMPRDLWQGNYMNNLSRSEVSISLFVVSSDESRLQALFPDVTSGDLTSAVLHSTSEQAAINRPLAQEYVMTEC